MFDTILFYGCNEFDKRVLSRRSDVTSSRVGFYDINCEPYQTKMNS